MRSTSTPSKTRTITSKLDFRGVHFIHHKKHIPGKRGVMDLSQMDLDELLKYIEEVTKQLNAPMSEEEFDQDFAQLELGIEEVDNDQLIDEEDHSQEARAVLEGEVEDCGKLVVLGTGKKYFLDQTIKDTWFVGGLGCDIAFGNSLLNFKIEYLDQKFVLVNLSLLGTLVNNVIVTRKKILEDYDIIQMVPKYRSKEEDPIRLQFLRKVQFIVQSVNDGDNNDVDREDADNLDDENYLDLDFLLSLDEDQGGINENSYDPKNWKNDIQFFHRKEKPAEPIQFKQPTAVISVHPQVIDVDDDIQVVDQKIENGF